MEGGQISDFDPRRESQSPFDGGSNHLPLVLVQAVPLVDGKYDARAGVDRVVQYVQVLFDDTFPGIHDDHGHFGAFQCRKRLHDGELLDGTLHPRTRLHAAPAAHTRGVDQQVVAERNVDRVAGGTRLAVDDLPLAANEPIDERRLADVGSPDDGYANPGRIDHGLGGRIRQTPGQATGELRDAPTMRGGHRTAIAEPQRGELEGGGRRCAVHLVDDHHDFLAVPAQVARNVPIRRRQTLPGIGNEHRNVGLDDRQHRLVGHLLVDVASLVRQAPGVDQRHVLTGNPGPAIAAVPGQSGEVGDQCVARAAQPIE